MAWASRCLGVWLGDRETAAAVDEAIHGLLDFLGRWEFCASGIGQAVFAQGLDGDPGSFCRCGACVAEVKDRPLRVCEVCVIVTLGASYADLRCSWSHGCFLLCCYRREWDSA